jgi:NTP pyrophosphatase (non-canonical NTP hydrolase)
MTPDEYQQKCKRTERPEKIILEVERARILHGAVGMATEAGELLDNVKRSLFYGKEIDKVNVMEECGDALWYIAIALDACGYTMTQAMQMNIAKLSTRYPERFTEDAALNRDLGLERSTLEGK